MDFVLTSDALIQSQIVVVVYEASAVIFTASTYTGMRTVAAYACFILVIVRSFMDFLIADLADRHYARADRNRPSTQCSSS